MKGIITFYINFHPENGQDVNETIDLIKTANKEVLDLITKDTGYRIVFIPTTKEACRIEKIDFDLPFPRFSPKSHYDLGRARSAAAAEKDKTE